MWGSFCVNRLGAATFRSDFENPCRDVYLCSIDRDQCCESASDPALPYDLQDGYIFGFHAMSFIWSFFLVVSFVLAIATTRLLSSYSGLGREALRTGSIVLIVLYVLGFVGAIVSC